MTLQSLKQLSQQRQKGEKSVKKQGQMSAYYFGHCLTPDIDIISTCLIRGGWNPDVDL